jgi:hypothetical protein
VKTSVVGRAISDGDEFRNWKRGLGAVGLWRRPEV